MKYIVFGDTGGHYRQLYAALRKIGMTEDYVLPDDIHIIHLGDLVHKGLYSTQILRMIEEIRWLNPEQWTQIIGNHEAQYLGGYIFWSNRVDEEAAGILHKWYKDKFLKFVHIVNTFDAEVITENKTYHLNVPIFFTHAGISRPFWKRKINEGFLKVEDFHTDGVMLGRQFDPEFPVGPVWAHGILEVWAMWRDFDDIHFNQIVGHIAPYQFGRKAFYPGTLGVFKECAVLHENERMVMAPLNIAESKWMGFMDPGYSKYAPAGAQPYLTILTNN